MNIRKVLVAESISLELRGQTKDEILSEMVDLLAASGRIKDPPAVLRAVVERERKMSTGMQNGIAIPHGKTNAVDGLYAALGLKKNGVDFQSLDGQPTRIIIATISPDNRTGPHIQFLAEVSRHLNSPGVRDRVLQAVTAEEILTALSE